MQRLHLDFESRSALKLGKGGVGLYRYAEHLSTSVWCFAWRFGNDGPVNLWWRGDPFPSEVFYHVAMGGIVVAHNAGFERRIWNVVLNRMHDGILPVMQIEQMDCTAARARAVGLPGDLERSARIVRAPHQKDVSGSATMKKMAKPRKVEFTSDKARQQYEARQVREVLDDTNERTVLGVGFDNIFEAVTITWWHDAELHDVLSDYCKTDVLAETGVDMVVPALSDKLLKLYQFNERVNDRGIPIDLELVDKVEAVLDISAKRANNNMWTLTGGVVKKCTDHGKVKTWLDGQGVRAYKLGKDGEEKQSVAKGVTDDLLLAAGTNQAAREVIELHNGASKLAYAGKIGDTRVYMNDDERIRGVFMFHTSPTGRFSATTWQAQNLIRVDEESELPTLRQLIGALDKFNAAQATDFSDLYTGRTLHWMAKMSRPVIKASPGKLFKGADLSNIEGRVNAWLAGEQWKLDAFRAFDNKTGPDLYKVTAGSILGVPPADVTKLQRQTLGKVPDLAGGYQGAVMAYVSMSQQLGVNLVDIADVAAETTDPAVWAATAKTYRERFACGLEQSVWTGLKVVVNAWRERHPAITQSWWDRQDAAIEAVSNPGHITSACDGKIRYLCNAGFLWCLLPSGRTIAYPQPEIIRVKYIREEKQEVNGVMVLVEVEAWKNAVQTWGLEKGQWVPYSLYGGHQCENDTQGTAFDICFDGALDLDALGYNLIFHCHDELLSEDDPNFGSTEEMVRVLSQPRSYAPGLPLAAAAWEDERYVK